MKTHSLTMQDYILFLFIYVGSGDLSCCNDACCEPWQNMLWILQDMRGNRKGMYMHYDYIRMFTHKYNFY